MHSIAHSVPLPTCTIPSFKTIVFGSWRSSSLSCSIMMASSLPGLDLLFLGSSSREDTTLLERLGAVPTATKLGADVHLSTGTIMGPWLVEKSRTGRRIVACWSPDCTAELDAVLSGCFRRQKQVKHFLIEKDLRRGSAIAYSCCVK